VENKTVEVVVKDLLLADNRKKKTAQVGWMAAFVNVQCCCYFLSLHVFLLLVCYFLNVFFLKIFTHSL